MMRFGRPVSLPDTLRFAIRKSVIKGAFEEFADLSCHFGSLSQQFKFDSMCIERPELHGQVVASLSVSRRRTSIMQFYPIPAESYPEEARIEFASQVVPYLRNWLDRQMVKPETAVLGYEELIVAWSGSKHTYCSVKFR